MKKYFNFVFFIGLGIVPVVEISAQQLSRETISQYAQEAYLEGLHTLIESLQIPNDGHYPAQIEANVNWCMKVFSKAGLNTQVLKTKGAPLVFASSPKTASGKSILFYLQIDGQPVDTAAWFQESPFKPALKEMKEGKWREISIDRIHQEVDPDWRLFARSSSDSKGPAVAFLTALKIFTEKGLKADYQIKVIMDFQEEMGSPSLPGAVETYRDLMEADMLLIMDGTRHVSNLPTLTFGARGIATIQLTVYGASRNMHSGQYGNFAPNPAFKLAKLLAGMKDEQGRVLIPGYYDGVVLSEERKALINDVPEDKAEIEQSIGIAKADAVGGTYQEALQYPSLNVRGMRSAWVGKEVRTIVPAEAMAEIDIRLVPETDGLRQVNLVKQYILDQGYHLIDRAPTMEERQSYPKLATFTYRLGSKAFRTEMDSPIGEWLGEVMDHTFGEGKYVRMANTGGSQPIAPFINTLGIPAVSVRIPNPDNSIHAPNENLRLGNFLEGIQTCLGILTKKF